VSFPGGVRLVVEDMDETVPYLDEIDVTGYEPSQRRRERKSRSLPEAREIMLREPDRHLDRNSDGVIQEHESLEGFVTRFVRGRRLKREVGELDRRILLPGNSDLGGVKVAEELRSTMLLEE